MQHDEDKEVRGLSVVARYTITAVALAIVTAIEVLVLYPPLAAVSDNPKIALLCFLGISKFVVVVALFMHLWGDDPLFTGIFGLGLVIGAGTLVALLAVMSVYPPSPNAIKPPTMRQIYEDRAKKHSEGADAPDQHSYCQPLLAGVRSA
jgi:heme/copper-type cytochrome/quinol oxidase subunit 4